VTGEKNRYQTFEKMNKLEDKDLTTPAHDALVLELLDPSNYVPFLQCIGYNDKWKFNIKSMEYCKDRLSQN
jgi:hypothetical protein